MITGSIEAVMEDQRLRQMYDTNAAAYAAIQGARGASNERDQVRHLIEGLHALSADADHARARLLRYVERYPNPDWPDRLRGRHE